MMTEQSSVKSQRRARFILAGLFALFFLPIFAAWVLNVELPRWLPFGKTNHGNLVEPAAQFGASVLTGVDGLPADGELLEGKWTLVYIEPSACRAECEQAVYRMRQSRVAMGKEINRVQKMVITSTLLVKQAAQKLLGDDPDLKVVAAAPEWLNGSRPGKGEAQIYIVDPRGFLVMWYSADVDPGGLIKDLKRLLKISKIG